MKTYFFFALGTKPETQRLVLQYQPEPILEAYRQGRSKFDTTDLVIIVGDRGGVFNVGFSSRTEALAKLRETESPDNPILGALARPAHELLKARDGFWLWILRDDGTMCFCAVGIANEQSAVAS